MEIRVRFDAAVWFISALCAFITSGAVLIAYPALLPWLAENSSNIASWVQAVGSIVAIIAGFKVARFSIEEQARKQAHREYELARQRFRKSCFLLFDICSQCTGWAESVIGNIDNSDGNWSIFVAGCGNVISRMNELNPEDYPDSIYIFDVTRLRVHLFNIHYLISLPPPWPEFALNELKIDIKKFHENAEKLKSELFQNAKLASTQDEIKLMEEYNASRFGN
ncbi:hypothetical protein I6G96_26850 [Delftia acidovorans]|uniref:hypothetical protein n=1 Tax=Delftia acidovorans TaxID=80866 RepID=UPI0018D5F013|nr:hypothetical protein [Delftia acidovorans]QPR34496.1 hypothetical protein I6G96_26850 [Delftia acidovorans]